MSLKSVIDYQADDESFKSLKRRRSEEMIGFAVRRRERPEVLRVSLAVSGKVHGIEGDLRDGKGD